jgi:Tol biopolymer transport system component
MIKTFVVMIATLIVLTSSVSSQEPINATGEGYWLSVQNRAVNILEGESPSGTVFESDTLALVAPPNSQINPAIAQEATALTPEPTVIVEAMTIRGTREPLQQNPPTSSAPTRPSIEQAPPTDEAPTRPPIEEAPATMEVIPTEAAPTRPPIEEAPQRPTETLPVPPGLEATPDNRPTNEGPVTLVVPSPTITTEPVVTVVSTEVRQPAPEADVVEQACAAEATYVTPPGQIPVTIEWTVTGTNIDSVLWEFHDGTSSNSTTVTFTYDEIGTFPVILTCYGPLGEIVVNNSVEIYESSGTEVGIATITPTASDTSEPSNTPTITNTPRPTRTRTPTITPGGPSLTPSLTRTPRPTNTPAPPTETPTITLTPTPETICVIGVLPDPNTPGAYQFYLTESQNVENVVWHINGQTYYGTEITAIFIESGVYEVEAECISAYDIITTNAIVEIEVVTSIEVGEGTVVATLTSTPQPQPQPSQTPTYIPPTNVPPTDVPPSTVVPPTNVPPEGTVPPTSVPLGDSGNANGWSSLAIGSEICVDWIVYHTNRTEAVNIFRLGELPNGETGNENLSRGEGADVYDLSPSLSPDKRWVAFVSNRDGNMELFISSVNRNEILQLTFRDNAQNANPVWSPDGRYILFESNMGRGDWELYAFSLATGTYQRVTNSPGRDINANWSPDGSRIIFQSEREGSWNIYETAIGTSNVQALGEGMEPVYSEDGSQIIFRRSEAEGQSALYVMNRDGSDVVRISEPAMHVGAHTWSPDNRLIAYQSNVTGTSQIYVYEPESETTRQVTDGALPAYAPTWKCDSSEAVIFTYDLQGKSEIVSANTYPLDAASIDAGQEAINLTNSVFEDGYPQGLTAQLDAMAREINARFEIDENITVRDE